ncbi:hypothetical protein THAOC_27607 [Thalassiosira oceanica]|uniref:ABC transporter domain-containing protein n=1 Tax=Thalassiosira oceanica TaxID=159749 RepID=K0S277_THAOC|nr:hypothetical protein THAOC_27607 [Thalassiosira oceanica]|eukprot:EJK53022.1 hypothetical protein THAOC_27607 [Thalassiosira oceanica]
MSSTGGRGRSSGTYRGGGGRGRSYRGGRGRGRGRGRGLGGGPYGGRGEHSAGENGDATPQAGFDPNVPKSGGDNGGSHDELVDLLRRLDGKSYPAYHDIESSTRGWANDDDGYTLYVARAQSDPFAKPTRCRVIVKGDTAKFPTVSYQNRIRTVALSDFLNRMFYDCCRTMGADVGYAKGGGWGGPKGGDIDIAKPTQHVVEQSAVRVLQNGDVCAQFTVNLPARGRSIQGLKAVEIFGRTLPELVRKALVYTSLDAQVVTRHVLNVEDQEWVRSCLEMQGLVAFVPDGATLPRKSGADDTPMEDGGGESSESDNGGAQSGGGGGGGSRLVHFQSPESLRVSFDLPNMGKTLSGIGIQKGVTLITGGGFHGKSTVLAALQVGMYNKVPGDGREFCVCSASAVKIRSEDGRNVSEVNISPFIANLPFGKNTEHFTTADASGSTSQAANIMEALEMGAKTLLIDEDTCATNFMIRDDKMMRLVHKDKEPITPFLYKIKTLAKQGISVVLVVGSCGDFFDVADTVILMDSYACRDVTEEAKKIVTEAANPGLQAASTAGFGTVSPRCPVGSAFKPNGKVVVRSKTSVSYGNVELDLSGVEQLVSKEQTNAITLALQRLALLSPGSKMTIFQVLTQLNALFDQQGLDTIAPGHFDGSLARPRTFELAAAVNRLRAKGAFVQL